MNESDETGDTPASNQDIARLLLGDLMGLPEDMIQRVVAEMGEARPDER